LILIQHGTQSMSWSNWKEL